jgi:hypothetical protein
MTTAEQLKSYGFKPKERAIAKASGETTYFTGRPCKHGHISQRQTFSGTCVECSKLIQKKHADKRIANNPNWYKENYAKNPERQKQKSAQYRIQNPEKVRKSYLASMRKRKPQKAAAEMARQAKKLQATPPWLTKEDLKQIDAIYVFAKETTSLAGFDCSVDHIVPLRGKEVCGLHVPWNLRVVSRSYNSKKHNNLDNAIFFAPSQKGGILVHESALPWNWRK